VTQQLRDLGEVVSRPRWNGAIQRQQGNLLARVVRAPMIGVVSMVRCNAKKISGLHQREKATQPIVELPQGLGISSWIATMTLQ